MARRRGFRGEFAAASLKPEFEIEAPPGTAGFRGEFAAASLKRAGWHGDRQSALGVSAVNSPRPH
jgi:hypothetical protein